MVVQVMAKRILLVEDDQDLTLGLTVRLQSEGFRVTSAPDSITALGLARTHEPDLILLDLGLPGGDGMTFLSRLRTLPNVPFIPVIVVTARRDANREAILAAGVQDFFEKPVDNEALLASIRSQIGDEAALESG
jgi:two-component system sensor histidine kinase/response regulator